jgi:hypothetical protein
MVLEARFGHIRDAVLCVPRVGFFLMGTKADPDGTQVSLTYDLVQDGDVAPGRPPSPSDSDLGWPYVARTYASASGSAASPPRRRRSNNLRRQTRGPTTVKWGVRPSAEVEQLRWLVVCEAALLLATPTTVSWWPPWQALARSLLI